MLQPGYTFKYSARGTAKNVSGKSQKQIRNLQYVTSRYTVTSKESFF